MNQCYSELNGDNGMPFYMFFGNCSLLFWYDTNCFHPLLLIAFTYRRCEAAWFAWLGTGWMDQRSAMLIFLRGCGNDVGDWFFAWMRQRCGRRCIRGSSAICSAAISGLDGSLGQIVGWALKFVWAVDVDAAMDRRHLFCCCWLMDRRHLFCCCCCCWFGGGLIVGTDRWLGGAMFIFLRKVSFFCLLFFSCIFSNIQPVPFSFYRWQQWHHIARWEKIAGCDNDRDNGADSAVGRLRR